VAQARGESIDSALTENASRLIADLASEPTPHNKYQLAQLVSFAVNEIAKPTIDWLSHIADVKSVGFGEKAVFTVRQEGIQAVIQAKAATTPRSKISHKQISLDTIAVSARPVIHLYELKTNRIQMSDLIRDAAFEMQMKQLEYIQNVLRLAVSAWATPFYGSGTGIIKTILLPMLQHWMRTGSVALLGDIAIISKLAEQTGFTPAQYSPNIIDEVMQTGIIGSFYGAKVISMVNPYHHDNLTPVLDINRMYLLPSAAVPDMRNLKVVMEGDTFSVESTSIDDMAYEVRLDQYFGAGLIYGKNPTLGVYVDNSI
jgi:hypothetical protein